MKLEDVKLGMTVFYDRFPGTDEPIEAIVDSVTYRADKAYVWISPVSKEPRFLAPLGKLSFKGPRIVAILKVKYLEAIASGFEAGDIFSLDYHNKDVFPEFEALKEFLSSIDLLQGYAEGGWDYAVYKVEPEGIPVNVGPGDQIVIYEDKKFGVYAGVGKLNVVDNAICVGR